MDAQPRPYSFKNLPKRSQVQVTLEASLRHYLGQEPFQEGFVEQLSQTVSDHLKLPCQFSPAVEVRAVDLDKARKILPETGCFVVVGASPTEHKILIDLDTNLSSLCIDKLLGGKGDSGRIVRALTEIEQGVLSFILLKVLHHFHQGWQGGSQIALTLDRIVAKDEDAFGFLEDSPQLCMVGTRIGLGKRVGYARIFMPGGLLTETFGATPPQQGNEDLSTLRQRLQVCGDIVVPLRFQVADIDLDDDDLRSLEPGDIVLLENHELSLGPTGAQGLATARLGLGRNGYLRGRVFSPDEFTRFEIDEMVIQEEPLAQESPMDEFGQQENSDMMDGEPSADEQAPQDLAAAEDNLGETEGLLRDVAAPVVVELGRIQMNTSQVIRLHQGQVLKLARGPNDPVNLVVGGKVFARGELIEVDGELGVRLLNITGQ